MLTVKITFSRAKAPVLFSAEHNGLEWKCLIMPFEPKENAPENSIVWAKKPYLETRKNESIDKDRIATMKDMADFAEAKAQEMEAEAARIKQQADDVAILEKQLPHIDRSVREIAGTSPNIDYNKVRRISADFARGNLSAIINLIPEQTESTKWARDLFEKMSGLTLPGTPEGNKAMAVKWASEQAAKGTPIINESANDDSGSFSIAEDLKENINLSADNKMKKNTLFAVCSCPDVLRALGEKNMNVVTESRAVRKMHKTHNLSKDDIFESLSKLNDPEYVVRDSNSSYIFIPGVLALNVSIRRWASFTAQHRLSGAREQDNPPYNRRPAFEAFR